MITTYDTITGEIYRLRRELNKTLNYNEDQPRAPAGSSNGGQWVSDGVDWVMPSNEQLALEYRVEHELKGKNYFSSEEEFLKAVKKSPVVTITNEEDSKIHNRSRTSSFDQLLSLISTYRSFPQYRNETKLRALYDAIKNGSKMDMPIVLHTDYGKEVFSGNTRMDISFQLGKNPKVIMLDVRKRLKNLLANARKELNKILNSWEDQPRAPEGSPNGGQWISGSETETKEFKEWFSGSKVVDSNGKPKALYHQTDNDFENFKDGWDGVIWTAEDTEYFEHLRYGSKTIPIYSNAKKILDLTPLGDHISGDQFGNFLAKHGIDFQFIPPSTARTYVPFVDAKSNGIVNKIKAAGYDAVYLPIHSVMVSKEYPNPTRFNSTGTPIKSYNGYLFFSADNLRFADGKKSIKVKNFGSVFNYDPDQARAPAGTSEGGQWISDGSAVTSAEEGTAAMKKHKRKLSDDHKWAVSEYTEVGYQKLNRNLRFNDKFDPDGKSAEMIKIIDSFFDSNPPKYNGTTYRGMGLIESEYIEFMENVKVGGILQDKAYLSTSVDSDFAQNFNAVSSNYVFIKIKSKSGVYLNGLSAEPDEKEVLFKRGTKFRVVDVVEAKREYQAGTGLIHKKNDRWYYNYATIVLEEI